MPLPLRPLVRILSPGRRALLQGSPGAGRGLALLPDLGAPASESPVPPKDPQTSFLLAFPCLPASLRHLTTTTSETLNTHLKKSTPPRAEKGKSFSLFFLLKKKTKKQKKKDTTKEPSPRLFQKAQKMCPSKKEDVNYPKSTLPRESQSISPGFKTFFLQEGTYPLFLISFVEHRKYSCGSNFKRKLLKYSKKQNKTVAEVQFPNLEQHGLGVSWSCQLFPLLMAV